MNTRREWSELEIGAIVQGFQTASENRIMTAFARQNVVLDKVADGAQAQVLMAAIMTGDPTLSVKGFIPEVRERLDSLEIITRTNRADITTNHNANTSRLATLENGQHKILKAVKALCSTWTHTAQGEIDYRKVSGLMIATWGAMHFILSREFWIEARRLWIEITSVIHL